MEGQSGGGGRLDEWFAPHAFNDGKHYSGEYRRILHHRCVLHEGENTTVCWLGLMGMRVRMVQMPVEQMMHHVRTGRGEQGREAQQGPEPTQILGSAHSAASRHGLRRFTHC